jgi:hypothetical protein
VRAVLSLLAALVLSACAAIPPDVPQRRAPPEVALPPMKSFGPTRGTPPTRSNRSIAANFLDLSFRLESGRELPVLTRFEGPVTVRVVGPAPATLSGDLDQLLARLRSEAGLPISRVPGSAEASITIEVITRAELQRAVPQAACFVVPRVSSWAEFRRDRRNPQLDWTTLRVRERMAVFVPADVAPQEVRDCLHEEVAQALGPLNDLYELTDSVFNDDNFHTVLTGFDMLILRATYAPELRSGMTRAEVAAVLPVVLARLNPRGEGVGFVPRPPTTRDWIDAIETALGPRTAPARRRDAAAEAVAIARSRGWNDNRLGFSLYALGRLSLGAEPDLALASFLQARQIFARSAETAIHEAHVNMQLAAFALSAGQADFSLEVADASIPVVVQKQNAALLSSLLLVRAESLEALGQAAEAQAARVDSLGWARYGFGSDQEVLMRAAEIASLRPRGSSPS